MNPDDAVDAYGAEPETVRYHVPAVIIDGPPLSIGDQAAFKVHGTIEPGPADAPASGVMVTFRIGDWAGPWLERLDDPDPPAIPDRIIDATASAIEQAARASDPEATDAELARVFAHAAIEGMARLVWPTRDEAASLALGVYRLDVEKLRTTGDAIVECLRDHADGPDSRLRELVALWRGQAHGNWAAYHELRGHGPVPPADRTPGDDTVVQVRVRTTNLAALEQGVELGIDALTERPIELRLVLRDDGIHDLEVVTGFVAKAAIPDPVDPEIVP